MNRLTGREYEASPPTERWVALVLRKHAGRAVTRLGEGIDHIAFDVDGAFVVRVRKHPGPDTAAAIAREASLLDVVAEVSPIPVPEVVVARPDEGLLAVRRLPGMSLLDAPCPDPMLLVDQLAGLLASLYGIPPDRVDGLVGPDDYPLPSYLAEMADALPSIAPLLTPAQVRSVESFLAFSPPADRTGRTFCHNDLGAEHLLA
ncbi:MAG: aminoglycoside phosphotransferase family protein, partial [Actinomycetota bacterium]|nr:aminoglycoside phosphotransferase family protein [Actinomycetota bacterium]